MRLSLASLLLPVLATAEGQVPLKDQVQGWINKAKTLLPAGAPGAVNSGVPEASTSPGVSVTPVTVDNWSSLLAPISPASSKTPQEWLIFITGGDERCVGECRHAEKAWNDSVPLFAADPKAPSLGYLDCEKDALLCSIWWAHPPSLWHFQVPVAKPGQPKPPTPLHVVHMNFTAVTPEDIYKVYSEKTYEENPAYEGVFHPMDGWLVKLGLIVILGYINFWFSKIPSWTLMIFISFISRSIMSRRFGPTRPEIPQGGTTQ